MKSPDQTRQGAIVFEARTLENLRDQAARAGTIGLRKTYRSVAEFAPAWMEYYVQGRNKPSVIRKKRQHLRSVILPIFGKDRLEDITSQRIEQFVAIKRHQGLATNTINDFLSALSGMLRCAVEWGAIARAPKVRFFKPHYPGARVLEPVESARLLAAAPTRMWRTMVLLGLRTGLRVGELMGLPWENVDLERKRLYVRQALVNGVLGTPKNGEEREIPLTNDAVETLRALGPGSGWVFRRRNGRPLTLAIAHRGLKVMRDRAELPRFGWHALRHTYATRLSDLGVPLRRIQYLLGHATLQMTMRYSHVSSRGLEESVELLDEFEERDARRRGHQTGHQVASLASEATSTALDHALFIEDSVKSHESLRSNDA